MLDFNWTLILQFINFMVLLYLLNRILFKPLRKVLDERQSSIDGGHARARELQADIDDKMERYQQQLAEAKKIANEERALLKKAAHEEEGKTLEVAHKNAANRLLQIKERVALESAEAGKVLKSESEAIAQQIAAKILGRSLL